MALLQPLPPLLFLKKLVSSSLPPGSPGTVRTRARASCQLRSVGVQLPHGSGAREKLWSQVGRGRGRRRAGQTGGLGACLCQLPSQESPVFSLMAFHVANMYQAWGLPGCSHHSHLAQRLLAHPPDPLRKPGWPSFAVCGPHFSPHLETSATPTFPHGVHRPFQN